ncbi:MAG: hypothetical protein ACOYLD_07855, partial [Anaerohalosphaeraceae bacterium]
MVRQILTLSAAVSALAMVAVYAIEEVADPLADGIEQLTTTPLTEPPESAIPPPDLDDLVASLPEDTTPTFEIREIRISGNTLLDREALLGDLPAVFDA